MTDDLHATTLFLLRHGATANNLSHPPRLQGRMLDPPLSDEGLIQAEKTGEYLSDSPLVAVYASPLLRARQTAEAIAKPHGLSVRVLPEIIECDIGQWEGKSWDEIAGEWPEAHRLFHEDPGTHGYLGGENLSQVLQRVLPAFERLLQEHRGNAVAIVAHNVVNRAFLAYMMGLPLAKARGIWQDNCGLNVIGYRGGKRTLVTLNSVFHLEHGE